LVGGLLVFLGEWLFFVVLFEVWWQEESDPEAEISGLRFRAAVSDSALVKSEKNAIIRRWELTGFDCVLKH